MGENAPLEISEFVWPEDRVQHIARHGVTPEEFEEVCFGDALVLRAKSEGKSGVLRIGRNQSWSPSVLRRHRISRRKGVSCHWTRDERRREAALRRLEEAMKIPTTDSIRVLAEFWDTHHVTDFPDELEEVSAPVFSRNAEAVRMPLTADELRAVREIAASRGVAEAALIHEWVREKLHH